MLRLVTVYAGLVVLAFFTSLVLTGCGGSIHTAAMPSSSVKLTPNPDHIYLAPMDTSTGKWIVGREGVDLKNFKEEFQTNFQHQLEVRMNKLAPTQERWVNDLPDHGWLVAGQFDTVFQGSRALRSVVGLGMGETTMQMTIYVYDLNISKTEYLLSFRTGVPDPHDDTGAGSGSLPAGLSSAGEPVTTGMGLGSGLKLDTTRTCREIVAVLQQYM